METLSGREESFFLPLAGVLAPVPCERGVRGKGSPSRLFIVSFS